MSDNTARLEKDGSIPEIEIVIGDAQTGSFACFLWDSAQTNSKRLAEVARGKFSIAGLAAKTEDLNQQFITWQGLVGAPAAGFQLYSVTVKFIQDDNVAASFTQRGSFQDSIAVNGSAKMMVE